MTPVVQLCNENVALETLLTFFAGGSFDNREKGSTASCGVR